MRKATLFNSGLMIVSIFVLFILFIFLKTSFTLSKITTDSQEVGNHPIYLLPELEDVPKKDENKFNFLLLGYRGENEPYGGLLTDAIMLVSFNRKTNQIALISIPRDLYIPMPNSEARDKLNAVYAWGFQQGGVSKGLYYIKETISRITGLYVDRAALVNFEGFEEFINAIGGIDIVLGEDFIEDKQWWCDEEGKNCRPFILPKGENHLDGETALFYIRSRFSSSDFDRARRQQEILLAIKKKLLHLGFIANPLNMIRLLDLLADNVRTDMKVNEIKEMAVYLNDQEAALSSFKRLVLDNSPNGFLSARHIEGRYVLLPSAGNFGEIREACLNISGP